MGELWSGEREGLTAQTQLDPGNPSGPSGSSQNSPSCYNSKGLLGLLIKLKPLYLLKGALEGKPMWLRDPAQKPHGPSRGIRRHGLSELHFSGSPGQGPKDARPPTCKDQALGGAEGREAGCGG